MTNSSNIGVTRPDSIDQAVAAWRKVRLPSRETALLSCALITYRILLDLGYSKIVAVVYGYQDFRAEGLPERWLLSWTILFGALPMIMRAMKRESISGNVIAVLICISFVPTTTLIAYDSRYPLTYICLILLYWIVLIRSCELIPPIRIFDRPLRSHLPHGLIASVLATTVLYISWRFTGLRLHFGLFDVYDLRTEARGFDTSPLIGYLATSADNILPVLIAYHLRRRWMLVGLALGVVMLLNYGISGTKQVLFLLIFAALSARVPEGIRLNKLIFICTALVVIAAIAEFVIAGSVVLTTLSLYRIHFIPAHLHWVYYDFFQKNPLLYLTQSALKFFVDSPYTENVQFLIGEYQIGDFTARANNGLFSDAYMNFGAFGVIPFAMAVALVLKILDGAAEELPSGVRFVVVIALSFVFLGLPVFTALLSAGVALLAIMLSTLPRHDVPSTSSIKVPIY